MKILDMKLVGRNFYDPTSATVLQQYRLVCCFVYYGVLVFDNLKDMLCIRSNVLLKYMFMLLYFHTFYSKNSVGAN